MKSAPLIKLSKKNIGEATSHLASFFIQAFGLGALLVLASSGGKIFFKQMTNQMPNYPFFFVHFYRFGGDPFLFYHLFDFGGKTSLECCD
jgi:hypothetical protein